MTISFVWGQCGSTEDAFTALYNMCNVCLQVCLSVTVTQESTWPQHRAKVLTDWLTETIWNRSTESHRIALQIKSTKPQGRRFTLTHTHTHLHSSLICLNKFVCYFKTQSWTRFFLWRATPRILQGKVSWLALRADDLRAASCLGWHWRQRAKFRFYSTKNVLEEENTIDAGLWSDQDCYWSVNLRSGASLLSPAPRGI